MKTTVLLRMVSGAEHEITLPTPAAAALVRDLSDVWCGRRAGPAHALHRTDGMSVTINPHHVETVEVH